LSPSRLIAVLDANVLYPARLRDLFIRLAIAGLYRARWSDKILDECFGHIVVDRPDLPATRLERTRMLMNVAVPDALVTDDPELVEKLDLPDPKDRHVLATAITAGASLVVTANLADFPTSALEAHGVEAISPDEFAHRLVTTDPDATAEVVERQAADLRNPRMTTAELLDGLAAVGLSHTVNALRSPRPHTR
jgi:predicted nucleic acid-binding protein